MADQAQKINIYQRIAAAAASLGHIEKRGKNLMQHYDYVQAADVIAEVRKAALSNGVLILPSVEAIEQLAEVETKSGGKQRMTRVKLRVAAINITDPTDRLEVIAFGDGTDSGDKAPYKAMTGALKYALLYLMMLPTGDDPERDNNGVMPQLKADPQLKSADKITSEQVIRLHEAAKAAGWGGKLYAQELKAKFGYGASSSIEREHYDDILARFSLPPVKTDEGDGITF